MTITLSIFRKVQAKRCERGCLGRITWFEAWTTAPALRRGLSMANVLKT